MANNRTPITISNPDIGGFEGRFARYMAALDPGCDATVEIALRLIANATERGQVCINLTDFAGRQDLTIGEETIKSVPELNNWIDKLVSSGLVGRPGDFAPLIIDQHQKLYLARYWNYEHCLAKWLNENATKPFEDIDIDRLRQTLDRLFENSARHSDMQKAAVAAAVLNRITIISGGPGTGKTTTVLRLLAALNELGIAAPARIALAASTGKAAARILDAINTATDMDDSIVASANFPMQAFTLHRLLGSRAESIEFQYNADNQLPLDVLIVDEASMIDLALMTKLVAAMPESARLILMGDKDQLSSVEAGAVFADICAHQAYDKKFCDRLFAASGINLPPAQQQRSKLGNSIVLLKHSFRFAPNSGLGKLATAIKNNHAHQAMTIVTDDHHHDICWVDTQNGVDGSQVIDRAAKGYADYSRLLKIGAAPNEALRVFNHFRILGPHKNGLLGTNHINRLIENSLREMHGQNNQSTWYHGRPIMITRNDYHLNLFNGDLGIALLSDGEIRVFFESTDKSIRSFSPSRLPEHETAYSMTVHKSQGSEFDEIVIILPEKPSEIMTRSLLYTAVTRARHRIEIWTDADTFRATIAMTESTGSGLYDRLRQ